MLQLGAGHLVGLSLSAVLFPRLLNAMQRNGMYNILSLWYDSTGYPTLTYRVRSRLQVSCSSVLASRKVALPVVLLYVQTCVHM